MGNCTQRLCAVSCNHLTPSAKVIFKILDLKHIYKVFTVCDQDGRGGAKSKHISFKISRSLLYYHEMEKCDPDLRSTSIARCTAKAGFVRLSKCKNIVRPEPQPYA